MQLSSGLSSLLHHMIPCKYVQYARPLLQPRVLRSFTFAVSLFFIHSCSFPLQVNFLRFSEWPHFHPCSCSRTLKSRRFMYPSPLHQRNAFSLVTRNAYEAKLSRTRRVMESPESSVLRMSAMDPAEQDLLTQKSRRMLGLANVVSSRDNMPQSV